MWHGRTLRTGPPHPPIARMIAAAMVPLGFATAWIGTLAGPGSDALSRAPLAVVPLRAAPRPCQPSATGRPAPGTMRPDAGTPAPSLAWRLAQVLDDAGTLRGWRLELPGPDGVGRTLDLPAESAVAGPRDGRIVVASDDGQASRVRLVDLVTGCEDELEPPRGVVRRAIPEGPDRVLAHLVGRDDREDLGTWRLQLGRRPDRVVDPLSPADRLAAGIERVWATHLALDADVGRLAVQSCDDWRCLTRVVDLGSARLALVGGPEQGPLVGLARDRTVTWSSGDGLPAAVLSWPLGAGSPGRIVDDATGAALSADGRTLVASVPGEDGEALVAFDLADGRTRSIAAPPGGARPVGPMAGMLGGLAVPPADVAGMTEDGRLVLISVDDEEVQR
jgi:hypothetical protein